jgi:hypothetical protein
LHLRTEAVLKKLLQALVLERLDRRSKCKEYVYTAQDHRLPVIRPPRPLAGKASRPRLWLIWKSWCVLMCERERLAVCHPEFLENLKHWVETVGRDASLRSIAASIWSSQTESNSCRADITTEND